MEAWLKRSAAEIGRGIDAGELSPVDLTEAYLEAIAGHPSGVRIYVMATPERARAEAMAAAHRAKHRTRRGPLDGVPVSWKDLFDMAGLPTESGSRLLKGRIPASDALLLARARAAGLVTLGKTHQTELAFSGLGLNPMTATPPNAGDPERVSGGSSSGAAASVAYGLAAAAMGSDTGGSVRIPAGWSDLVGLKTTLELLPLEGVVPLCPSFDTAGPLTRTVEDAALMLAALTGDKPADLAGASLQGRRLAVLETAALDDLDPGTGEAFASALRRLAEAGASITALAAPEAAEVLSLAPPIVAPEAYAVWGEAIEADPEAMFAPVRGRFLSGKGVPAENHIRAFRRLEAVQREWHERVAAFDAILLPTTAKLPPKIADLEADHDYFSAQNLLALRNTRIGNLLGLSAITLPTGMRHCGLMLFGKPFGERALLRVAAASERAMA